MDTENVVRLPWLYFTFIHNTHKPRYEKDKKLIVNIASAMVIYIKYMRVIVNPLCGR